MLLPSITFLDLETTGATQISDRITEIALVRFDHGVETARWETLVNPERPIPDFIQQLTGLDDAMVADAPVFSEVADQLLGFLDGTVLSAHNVRFDHGFLKAEFKRLGMTLRQKVLCTVKFSRLLYPEFKSHGLDAIMKRHGIEAVARHRAMGDVSTVLSFLSLAEQDLGQTVLQATAKRLMRGPSLPPHLNAQCLEDMPETPGVYLFYADSDVPIYIGKGLNVRARVLSYFNSDRASAKEKLISLDVKRIEWIDTAGEFGALLLESSLITKYQPKHNRRRAEKELCSWHLNENSHKTPLLTLVSDDEIDPEKLTSLYGTFKSKRQARETLRKLIDLYHLCARVIGLEPGKGACFAAKAKRCKGVCHDQEKPEIHYLRLQNALLKHQIKPWPYSGKIAIKEQNSENGLTQMHVFSHWQYEGCVDNEADLHALLESRAPFKLDLDTYKLLCKKLESHKTIVIELS